MSLTKMNNDFTKSFDSLSIKTNTKSNGKPKRKNSEKRKEKSRKAARERRSQEAKIFDQMEQILPIPTKTISHLDKASLVRLAINFLKIRKVIEPIKSISSSKYMNYENESAFDEFSAIKALNGFMMVLSKEGDMVYLSENVEKYLGLAQIDLIGQSIYDFSHPCDHNDIKDTLAPKSHYSSNTDLSLVSDIQIPSSFSVRMKCTLTNKGRNLNLKSASYKVIHFSGHLLNIRDPSISSNELPSSQSSRYFMITIGEPLEHPYSIEKPSSLNVFVSRHSLDMKYTNVDDRIQKILGYNQKEMMGKSLFNFFHALDLPQLEKFFKTLFAKGQSESGYYRFLAKSGGHLWLLTQATVITDSHSSQPQSVICVNHVISGIENQHQILSEEQCSEEETAHTIETVERIEIDKILSQPSQTSFVSSTKTVFAPKTADMEDGFIVFTDDANGIAILPDPDDLTHLAPEAGDVCVPMPGLLGIDFSELNFFEEVFMNQNGCNGNFFGDDDKLKLNDENLQFNCNTAIHDSNIDDVFKDKDESEGFIGKHNDNGFHRSVTQNFIRNYPNSRDESVEDSQLPNDPFLSYHDEIFSTSPSNDSSDPYSSKSNSPINISSPILSQTSNYFCKTPDCEEVSKLNISDTNDFVDDKVLEMRAPFCPVDEDFPLILNEDLQIPYSSTNIDELINFEALPSKPLISSEPTKKPSLVFDNSAVVGQQSGCLEMLLQSNDSQQKSKKFNLNQAAKQNIDNSGLKININNVDSNLLKCDNNPISINKVQLVYNNTNQMSNARKGGSIGKNLTNEYLIKIGGVNGQQFIMNSTKVNKTAFNDKPIATERIIIKRNDFTKPLSGNKRPYSSEPPDILYSICPNDILSNQGSSKDLSKESQNQKRVKVNNVETNNQGNSVLMNLLVNGEDVINGYSKYSNIDRVNQSSNFNMNQNIYQKFSNTKKNSKLILFDGQDIR